MYKVLFVCLGNICRSPSAEAVFRKKVMDRRLESKFHIDSAGILDYHIGEAADKRMQAHARKRDYDLTSISRPVTLDDLDYFDIIIAMDRDNYNDLLALGQEQKYANKISLMTDFAKKHNYNYVPDPYYGGAEGFELVLDLLDDACEGLLDKIESEVLNV